MLGRHELGRREFLVAGGTVLGTAALGVASACSPPVAPIPGVFGLGVASGLHSASEVVLWTRVELATTPVSSVEWEVADSPAFAAVVAGGTAAVSAESDGCVKVLVGGLDPDRSYWFRFRAGTTTSAVGRARTLPAAGSSPTSLRLGFAACQSYASGYYGAWRDLATKDVDAVLFLGDYIYEALPIQLLRRVRDEYTSDADTLEGYRQRYRLYRSDPDLQAAHAAHPFVVTWDDHEVVNDHDRAYLAEHPERAAAAHQAWFEYMPVWPVDGTRIHRELRWGDLADLFVLDARQYRDEHLGTSLLGLLGTQVMTGDLQAEGRTMLGAAQRQWLLDGLDAAQADGVRWKLVGNPVMIAPVRLVDLDTPEMRALDPALPKHAGLYLGTDSWDGFGWERDLVLSHLRDAGVSDVSFLTGDQHTFMAAPLSTDFDDPDAPVVAYEYTGGSISSPSGITDGLLSGGLPSYPTQPPFDHMDIHRNGYGVVALSPDAMTVTFHALVPTEPGSTPVPSVRFDTVPGQPRPTITPL
jgi:alkaline phosphatase D